MTVASEIERLQCAKADICTAIENKGVTVWNITLDEYACCIDSISAGWWQYVDALIVWGWGGWNGSSGATFMWWGWGGWWVIMWNHTAVDKETTVIIWCGGLWVRSTDPNNWWDTCFWSLVAKGGWAGWKWALEWYAWWSWWGGWWICNRTACDVLGWAWTYWYVTAQWYSWWSWRSCTSNFYSWGGGWAWWAGTTCGGLWIISCISGTAQCYAWGGGWTGLASAWCPWCYWWWDWSWQYKCWCSATTYWSWWGGSHCCKGWDWCQGIVIVRYPTDWSYGINSSTGWNCCYTCDGYCIHQFTSDGTFTITW